MSCCEETHLKVVDAHPLVQAGRHHHFPQDGHHGDGVTVALVDAHQLPRLQELKTNSRQTL